MKVFDWKLATVAAAAVALVVPSMAAAQQSDPDGKGDGQIQITIVPEYWSTATQETVLQIPQDRAGKAKVKLKPGKGEEGGLAGQLAGNLKVSCPGTANQDPKKGVCGLKGSPVEAYTSWQFEVLGSLGVHSVTKIWVEGGKIAFPDFGGKNKFNAAQQASASVIQGTSVGSGIFGLHEVGPAPTDPVTGCDSSPVLTDKSGCLGDRWGVAGIVWGPVAIPCANTAECTAGGTDTLICQGNECVVQECPGGDASLCNTGYCNVVSDQCCDPGTSTEPANCQSPSGAFLDPIAF